MTNIWRTTFVYTTHQHDSDKLSTAGRCWSPSPSHRCIQPCRPIPRYTWSDTIACSCFCTRATTYDALHRLPFRSCLSDRDRRSILLVFYSNYDRILYIISRFFHTLLHSTPPRQCVLGKARYTFAIKPSVAKTGDKWRRFVEVDRRRLVRLCQPCCGRQCRQS